MHSTRGTSMYLMYFVFNRDRVCSHLTSLIS